MKSKSLWILLTPILAFGTSLFLSDPLQRVTAFIAFWMILWWVFELVPLWITALLPLILPLFAPFPYLPLVSSYFHPVLLLFIGGFFLSAATEKSQIHSALAERLLKNLKGGKWALLSFMLLTAFLSMWISNSAACLIMIPLAALFSQHHNRNFHKALVLGIAYASSLGGLTTLIGSPPNALYLAHIQKTGDSVSFFGWMANALPFAGIGILIVWVYLGRIYFSTVWKEHVRVDKGVNAEFNHPILLVFAIFLAGLLFLHFGWLPVTENLWIFLVGTSLFFLRPKGKPLLQWKDSLNIPWNILLVFAGGLALSHILSESGLTDELTTHLFSFREFPTPILLLFLVIFFILLTEFASNTAVAAIGLSLADPLARALSLNPHQVAQAIVFAASLSFMLPIATPPNAIAFAKGGISGTEMAKIGLPLNLIFSVWITIWIFYFPI